MAALPIPLPLAVPAAAASLAYLNARFALSYDWSLLSTYVTGTINSLITEYRGNINLFHVLEDHALHRTSSNNVFLIHNGRQWTYRQAYDTALKYGTWLKNEQGVKSGEIVAMDFMNSDVFIWIWFGLWSIGAKPALINYNLTGKPLLHTVKTSTACLLLVDPEVRKGFSDDVMAELASADFRGEGKGAIRVIFADRELEAKIEAGEGIREPDEARAGQKLQDMAMLIYTSGTTGMPKPAIVSWTKASMGGRFVASWLPLKKTDVLYTCMPLYHSSASVLGLCSVLLAGSTLALGRRFSNSTFWPEVLASGATTIQYVGETCRYLLAAPPSPRDTQHKVRLAFGNGLRPDVWNTFKTRFNIPIICEFYGSTEGPSAIWNCSINDFSAGAVGRNGSIATMLLGSSLTIVRMDPDSDLPVPLRDAATGLCQVADWNEPGQMLYKLDPANIERKFQGYHGNSTATRSKILRDVKKKGDAWFSTGDVLRRDREGRWWFVDRMGDTFRWKSENVSTAEVSDVVSTHNAVREANIYGVLVPGHEGRAGCAAVMLDESALPKNDGADEKADALALPSQSVLRSLAAHCTSNLPRFAVPLFLRLTRQMHTTGTNKYQKHFLQQEGIDVEKIEASGDKMYWLRGGVYEPFNLAQLQEIRSGQAKL